MQDLTGTFTAALSPSSMNAGNTTADDRKLTMSAPGSVSVLPVPDKLDNLPQPQFSDGGQIPVSHPGSRDRVTVQSSAHGGGRYSDTHGVPAASLWKETN